MKTILVLTDFSKRSEHAAEFAWQLAIKVEADLLFYNSYSITPSIQPVYASAHPVYSDSYSAFKKQNLEELSIFADKQFKKFKTAGNEYTPTYRCENDPGNLAENVEKLLDKENIWMIVMGDKRNDSFLSEILLGSDVEQVINVANCPVLIMPKRVDFHQIRKVALALDKFEIKALNFLVEMAEPFDAEIVVAHVSSKYTMDIGDNELLEDFNIRRADLKYEKITFYNMKGDNVTKSLVKFELAAQLDIVAIIKRKHPLYEQLFHEGTTKKMMNYHNIALLVFPPAYNLVD